MTKPPLSSRRRARRSLLLGLAAGMCGLLQGNARPAGISAAAVGERADLVLTGGVIHTLDPQRPRVEALAVNGERIVAVGSSREVRAWVGKRTRVMDLRGRFVLPGFNDAHIHLAGGGQAMLAVDFQGAGSLAEFQDRIREALKRHRPGEWITGRGWDHTRWPEKRFPARHDLDAASASHPMIFTRVDGHVAVANSLALAKAGITRDTPDPPGGAIERDAAGQPTGLLKETAMGLVRRHVPPLRADERRRGIELALAEAARHGITSVQDNSDWEDFLIYEQLKREGKLTLRITEWLPFAAPLDRLEQMRRRGGSTDPWLKTGALKGVVDGTLGSRTAALLAPYADDPTTRGILRLAPAELRQMVVERDLARFQIALHAIGDAANRVALDAFAAARAANGKRDARHRIEHAQVVAPEDLPRFTQLDVIASMQPCHQTTDMRWAAARLGPERSQGAYAWKSMAEHGVRLAFGTDYAVEPMDPMRGLYACVTRELPEGGPTGGWIPREKLSVEECLRAYTLGSAYAEFEEGRKGQIAVGQLADLVVFAADVTRLSPEQLLATRPVMTLVGGRQVYPAP